MNDLYERYIDDETDALAALAPGVRFDGKKIVIVKEHVEKDKLLSEDVRTMNVLKDIGNSINKCVQFTIDCSSLQPSGMVPDLQAYVEDNQLIH